jgi:UDP-N-acetylglucosamine 4,6-dehydratase
MNFLVKKNILITGGTGSFGEALLKKIVNVKKIEIRIFSRDEKKQNDLRLKYSNKNIKFIIGDIRDYRSILEASYNVDYIFHAAALKQVPSCEFFPLEAVKTNILGTDNVLRAAIENNVKKIVLLSTDKAVYPINSMGMTKALMEKIMTSKSRNSKKTTICCVRYGNVMGSRGSIIPLLIKQIKEKKELTITNKNMTRFLMSLDQSIELVKLAFEKGGNGDIFILKSPSAKIENIAIALKNIFKSKNKIKMIGIRHGEKIYETLLSKEEMSKAFEYKKYYKIQTDNRDLNYELYFSEGEKNLKKRWGGGRGINVKDFNEYNSNNTKILNVNEIEKLIKKSFKL